jgi:hypothetical protein
MNGDSKQVTIDDLKKFCEERCTMYDKWFDTLVKFQMSLDSTAVSMRDAMTAMTESFTAMVIKFGVLDETIKTHIGKDNFHMVDGG